MSIETEKDMKIVIEPVTGSINCTFSVIENKLRTLSRNQAVLARALEIIDAKLNLLINRVES